MKRIGLPWFVAVLLAVCPVLGQSVDDPARPGMTSASQALHVQNSGFTSGFANTPILRMQHIQFANASPAVPTPIPGAPIDTLPVFQPTAQNAPAQNASAQNAATVQNARPLPVRPQNTGTPTLHTPAANNMPSQAPVMARPPAQPVPHNAIPHNAIPQNAIPQNAVTQNHRLRLPAQVFERNLVERLGSRSVPVQNVAADAGMAQYRLPARDGTAIELTVNRQQGIVSVTGSPAMVDACLRIVRLLDVQEVAGGSVTRFMPVQQSNVNATRQVANIVNQETLRVAQATPQPVAGTPVPFGFSEDELTAAGIVGPVEIDIIDALGTVIIQGSPGDVAIIQGMLRELEALSLENEPIIELIPIRHADSLRVSQLVQQLYLQVYQVRRGPITMLPLVKPNTILIIGRPESIDAAKELIAKLDTPVIPDANFRIFHLRHAAVMEVAPQINQSFMGRPGFGQGLAPQLNIAMDVRTNALIVQANPRDMHEIEAMIRQLDVPGGIVTPMRRFQLRNALATEMATVLTQALNSGFGVRPTMLTIERIGETGELVPASVLHNVAVVADPRSNSLIVTAPPETMALIAVLIEQLDQLPAAESRIRVFTLANADAFALTQLLTNMFAPTAAIGAQTIATVRPGFEEGESTLVSVRFQADIRTNSIVAIGSEGDLAIAEALLLRLDAESLNNRTVFTMRLVNQPADEIAPVLNQHFMTERQFNIQNAATFMPNSPQEQFRMETSVIAEPITNSLIISTTPQQYEIVRRIILDMDERPRMVAIDVLIAEVEIDRSRDRGVEFGLQDSILFNSAMSPAPAFPGLLFGHPGNTSSVGTQGITSLGVPTDGVSGFSFSASSQSVSLFIRALETNNRTQVLARPRLVALHNMRAQIEVGSVVPYAGGTNMTNVGTQTTIVERSVGTILDITPRIMQDGMIAIALYVERSSISGWRDIGGLDMPVLNNTTASTTLNAMDGETVVFAGLIAEERITRNNSVPGLNRIPVIRHLFESDSRSYRRTELIIILTPRLIRSEEDMMRLNQQERERMQWCVSDVVRLTGDTGMRRRSDEWFHNEVRHTIGTPVQLHESQLPADNRIPTPMFPTIETR